MKTKVLIIKLGYSETLDKEISKFSSMGDVIRTTVILHLFKNDDVTWLTDDKAVPLLYNNPYIRRILTYDFTTAIQLQQEVFDVVVNLEKVPGICAMADTIKAWKRFGFRFNSLTGVADCYMFAEQAMEMVTNDICKQSHHRTWQACLYDLLGAQWKEEDYILGYKPSTNEAIDVGFNYQVGAKWPTKAWKMENWQALEQLCKNAGLSVSWQEGVDNLYQYMDWINRCRVVVSNDSLGLHIGIALRKKVIGLFGATNEDEVYMYDRGGAVVPGTDFKCRPCNKPDCTYSVECINTITPEMIVNRIIESSAAHGAKGVKETPNPE